jgi:endonuclease/exonuclease/phosphatase family metal-dependent hydrolase
MDLRALTFNIRYDNPRDGINAWKYRREMALELVRSQCCHVVGFQEVMPHQRADLEAGLPEYRFLGSGRNHDGGGEQCCLAIDPALEILETGTFWLCPTPEVPGSVGWDAELTRICTWARLARDGTSLRVMNSHWDHVGERARVETARLLCDYVAALDEPVLLMGDFNTPPDSEPIALLTTWLRDVFASVHPHSPTASSFHGFGRTRGPRIDYLLASPEFLVVDSSLVPEELPGLADEPLEERIYPSDHLAVYGCFELIADRCR